MDALIPSWLTAQAATLIAAIIAAFASLAKLFFDRKVEDRNARRKLIEPVISDLAEALYEVLATSKTILLARPGVQSEGWRRRAAEGRARLMKIRPKVRYCLWGLDEGLRVVSRMPGWVQHAKSNEGRAKELIGYGTALRFALDVSIQRSYYYGRPPSIIERLIVLALAKKCRRIFESGRS